MRRRHVALLGAVLSACAHAASAQDARFEPYTLELSDGRRVPAELGRVPVPENRASPASRTVELAVIRLPSTSATPGEPILYLNGDPGGIPASRVLQLAGLYPAFARLREAGDVVVMDYRGTGMSRPRLSCPRPDALDPELFASRERMLSGFLEMAGTCAARLRADGTDLRGYDWVHVADDVAAVADALGAPQVRLVGFSSGTHAALATIRRHEGRVARAVLVGTEGMDHTRKLPSNVDRQLAAIAALARADSALARQVPDLSALMRDVLARLEREPAVVEVQLPDSQRVRGTVGRFALEFITAKSLSGPEEFAVLPRLYHSLSRGDTRLLASVVQRMVSRPPPSPLAYVMDGAAGVSPERWSRIGREAERSVLGNAVNFPFPAIRDAWGYGDLGDAYRRPVRSRVPVLFVTGGLDGNTPPHQAEEVRRGFPNGRSLVLENGGHGSAFASPEAMAAVVDFLAGREAARATVVLPPPRFAPLGR